MKPYTDVFIKGFYWGFLFFALHLYWLLDLLITHSNSIRLIPFWILSVSWFACIVAVWFVLQHYIHATKFSDATWVIVSSVSHVVFFYVLTYYSLSMCGVLEGYPLCNPLVLLSCVPQLLWCLKYIGFLGMLLSIMLCISFMYKKYYWIGFICILPLLSGFIFYQKKQLDMQSCIFLKPYWHGSKNPMHVGYKIAHDVTRSVCNNDNVTTIIMPESSFAWDITKYQDFIPLMCEHAQKVSIMLGTQRSVLGKLYNSYVVIQDGTVVFSYDKQHLLPLMERIPSFLDKLTFGEILCQKSNTFSYGTTSNDIIVINNVQFQLFVCSELFFEAKPVKGYPVLFVCNDAWFRLSYIKQWILYFITYFAARYDVPILFCTVTGLTNL